MGVYEPGTEVEAAEMVREIKAAPMLFGYRGSEKVDVDAIVRSVLDALNRTIDDTER